MGLAGGAGGPGVLIAEGQPVMDVVDDRLHPGPAGPRGAEQRPCEILQGLGLAVATAEQIDEGLVRKLVHRMLDSQGRGLVRQTRVPDQEVRVEVGAALRRDQPMAGVAEIVAIGAQSRGRRRADRIGRDQVVPSFGPDAQHQDHRRRRRALEADNVAGADQHSGSPCRPLRLVRQRSRAAKVRRAQP